MKKTFTDSQTGYPSIDKPWLKYYSDEAINSVPFKGSIYQHIYDKNNQYLDNWALQYFGRKISYKELFIKTDNAANALSNYGIKKGDNVVVLMTSCPELVYLLLAINKLGATANLINPLFTESQIKEKINDTDATLMIVLDQLFGLIDNIRSDICVKHIVVVPITHSMPLAMKTIARIKLKKKVLYDRSVICWNKFVSCIYTAPSFFNDNESPAIMVYSSGTTGASKGIVLTNKGINATIAHYEYTGFEYERSWSFLQIIPTWFSTGTVFCLFMPLCLGLCVILEPVFSKENFDKDIRKFKPNMIMGATSLWLYFLSELKKNILDLSFIKYPITGGEKILANTEAELNIILKQCGCEQHMTTGYGMCELGSTASATSLKYYKYGSTGYPIKGVTIASFDLITNHECKYGERGEIRVLTPARMKEYYKRPDATEEFFYTDDEGNEWGCTGDIGYIDSDGFLFVEGRATDSYTLSNGDRIYLFDIEETILKDESVDQCKVVETEVYGNTVLVGHIVLSNKNQRLVEMVIKRIHETLKANLKECMIPKYYKIRNSMPVHPNGKRDVEALKKDIESLIQIQ